jgi:hypothetical protein
MSAEPPAKRQKRFHDQLPVRTWTESVDRVRCEVSMKWPLPHLAPRHDWSLASDELRDEWMDQRSNMELAQMVSWWLAEVPVRCVYFESDVIVPIQFRNRGMLKSKWKNRENLGLFSK